MGLCALRRNSSQLISAKRKRTRKAKNKILAIPGKAVEMLVKAKTPATKVIIRNPKVNLSIYVSWDIDLLLPGPGGA